MRVGHFSSFDVSGGAARAAYRLHRGLVDAGAQSTMVVGSKSSSDPTVHLVPRSKNILSKLRRRLRYGFTAREIAAHAPAIARGHDMFSSDRIPGGIRVPDRELQLDVIQLHWISWFIDYEDFFPRLPPSVPIVWTLHDMNAYTGGCHYDAGCGRFREQCGRCPALESNSPDDLSSRIFRRKSAVFARLNRLHLVAPSRWQASNAQSSSLFKRFDCRVIPYGLDTAVFQPHDRVKSRADLQVPLDRKIVLFVADSAVQKRKGFDLLVEALKAMHARSDLFLLSVGAGNPDVAGIPHLHLGKVSDDQKLAAVYSAADVFVNPALQDNLPNTVLEALACGTPCVGFDASGVVDMIRPGVTGYVAPVGDITALRQAIEKILDNPASAKIMARNCRDIAVSEYTLETQSKSYLKLYESLLSS
jgi:glycosyltransferase involved in cell wall biosynthesis